MHMHRLRTDEKFALNFSEHVQEIVRARAAAHTVNAMQRNADLAFLSEAEKSDMARQVNVKVKGKGQGQGKG